MKTISIEKQYQLIAKIKAEQATDEEVALYVELISTDDEFCSRFETFELLEKGFAAERKDVKETKKLHFKWYYFAAAASVILGFGMYFLLQSEKQPLPLVQKSERGIFVEEVGNKEAQSYGGLPYRYITQKVLLNEKNDYIEISFCNDTLVCEIPHRKDTLLLSEIKLLSSYDETYISYKGVKTKINCKKHKFKF